MRKVTTHDRAPGDSASRRCTAFSRLSVAIDGPISPLSPLNAVTGVSAHFG
jgi:hypothetical protein